ncbi:MAG: hypothetical protein HY891_05675 [Deltaproteobacteria bacterium]|nr:hypothetical protein [Deltaproteobacteria bacterium]
MSIQNLLILWPNAPVLSLLVWVFGAAVLLYLGRIPAHQAIKALTQALGNAFKTGSRSVLRAGKKLGDRNREVLLASGAEAVERSIEREFHRVDSLVKKELNGYPALQRNLSDLIARIDEDYGKCAEVPPSPTTWVNAVEAVAKLKNSGESMVAKMLGDIKNTINDQHKSAMEEYRKTSSERHSVLNKMAPFWRKTAEALEKVGKNITGLHRHSSSIDKKMGEFEEIRAKSDKAVRVLTASSLTQFFISGLVLLIAIGGAAINFNLIALPMSEMVGGGNYIGPYKTSNVAALVIIMVEGAMGLYLMEALRITGLFPVIGSMNDKMRTRMLWITFCILLILASVEASLAFMRDQIAADIQALRQSLSADSGVRQVNSWIPTAGQMVMGFILPFALAFVAIPFESFVHSSRTVLGIAGVGVLRTIALALRVLSGLARATGVFLISAYDVLISPALWVERLVVNRAHHAALDGAKAEIGAPTKERAQ